MPPPNRAEFPANRLAAARREPVPLVTGCDRADPGKQSGYRNPALCAADCGHGSAVCRGGRVRARRLDDGDRGPGRRQRERFRHDRRYQPERSSQASAGTATAVGGSVLQASGPNIPNLDPILTGSASWAHQTTPQSNAFITGTNSLIQRQDLSSVGIQKGFLTGTIRRAGAEQQSHVEQQPAQRLQSVHQLFAGVVRHAAPAAGVRPGGELAADPHREEQPGGLRSDVQTAGADHRGGGDAALLAAGGVQRERPGGAGGRHRGSAAVRGQQAAGRSGHDGAHRGDARRGADRGRGAAAHAGEYAGTAAGDDSEDRAEP